MNVKQKLGYMFIGCLFTIAGYILASLGEDTIHAQQKEQVIEKIVCRELKFVKKEGNAVVKIDSENMPDGVLSVYNNTTGKQVVLIIATENGNEVISSFASGDVVATLLLILSKELDFS